MRNVNDPLESEFYKRQTVLKEIGLKGQELLKTSKVLIVGAGGLGHPVATYLAASGVGELTLCDGDLVEFTNLHRQVLFSAEDVGKPKSNIVAKIIKNQNPFINVKELQLRLDVTNAPAIIKGFDIIVDCTDNFPTKFLLHDLCWSFSKSLIQASLYQFEGQIQVFPFAKSKEFGCLRCLWPKTPEVGCVDNCQDAGIVGAVAGNIGAAQALEVLKLILGMNTDFRMKTLIINLLQYSSSSIKWSESKSCPLCGDRPSINGLEPKKKNYFTLNKNEVSTRDLSTFKCIDIRDKNEAGFENIEVKRVYPNEMNEFIESIDPTVNYLFICQKGIRSGKLITKINKENCHSLYGGWETYSQC
jgi:molybdopterin/thiamine biosynthesis adenylyltransferase